MAIDVHTAIRAGGGHSRPSPPAPGGLAAAGTAAWRLLGIGLLVVAAWWLTRRLLPVFVPLVVATLLATLVRPLAERLERRGAPEGLAAMSAVAALLAVLFLAVALVVPPVVARAGELGANVERGVQQLACSAAHEVAGVSRAESDRAVHRSLTGLRSQRGHLAGDLLTGASLLAQLLGTVVLVLFLCFFLVKDGERIGRWALGFLRPERRPAAEALGARAWAALGTYIRGVVFVATVDAVFIGLALILVGVPLALPLIVLTWLAAFFPIVGAVVAGAAAVLVALVTQGVEAAVVVGVAILVVQQLEGNVLYPVVVGPRLRLHPIAMLLAVTVGATVGGIAGAFLAVPVATVAAVAIADRRERAEAGAPLVAIGHG